MDFRRHRRKNDRSCDAMVAWDDRPTRVFLVSMNPGMPSSLVESVPRRRPRNCVSQQRDALLYKS